MNNKRRSIDICTTLQIISTIHEPFRRLHVTLQVQPASYECRFKYVLVESKLEPLGSGGNDRSLFRAQCAWLYSFEPLPLRPFSPFLSFAPFFFVYIQRHSKYLVNSVGKRVFFIWNLSPAGSLFWPLLYPFYFGTQAAFLCFRE